jgi:hypothetical protein
MRARVGRAPHIAIGSAVLVGLLAAWGMPLLRDRQAQGRADAAVAAALGCLKGNHTAADPEWRRIRIAAQASTGGWPSCCHTALVDAHTALRMAVKAAARCEGTCCAGDRRCALDSQLLADLLRIESDPLAEIAAPSLALTIRAAASAGISPNGAPAGCAPPPAPQGFFDAGLQPVIRDVFGEPRLIPSSDRTIGFERDGGAWRQCRFPSDDDDVRVACEAGVAPAPPPPVAGARVGPVRIHGFTAWAEDAGDRWRVLLLSDYDDDPRHATDLGSFEARGQLAVSVCRDGSDAVLVSHVPAGPSDEVLLALREDGVWHTQRVTAGAGLGLTCRAGGASLLWATTLGNDAAASATTTTVAIDRLDCARSGCRRAHGELALRRFNARSRFVAADLGGKVLVLHRGPSGELRMRIGALEAGSGGALLADAPDRALAEDAEHGGFDFETTSARVFPFAQQPRRQGRALLLLPVLDRADPRRASFAALRIAADGRVLPYRVETQ